MGDPLQQFVTSRNSVRAAGKDFPKRSLVAAIPRAVHQTIGKHVSFSRNGSGTVQNAAVFLLKVAVLEIVRRVSKAKCPHLWNTLQALQCFCYPPLKWIRRWAPFKDFIKAMQVYNWSPPFLSTIYSFYDFNQPLMKIATLEKHSNCCISFKILR